MVLWAVDSMPTHLRPVISGHQWWWPTESLYLTGEKKKKKKKIIFKKKKERNNTLGESCRVLVSSIASSHHEKPASLSLSFCLIPEFHRIYEKLKKKKTKKTTGAVPYMSFSQYSPLFFSIVFPRITWDVCVCVCLLSKLPLVHFSFSRNQ